MNIALDSLNTNSVTYKTDEDFLYLVDLSDIHVGNMYHNEKVFKKWIKTVQGIPNMRVIIGGDSTDNASTHSASSPYEELLHGGDQVLKIRDLLLPIKDKILFCRSGNHGYERALKHNKLIPEHMLAELLGVPFLHGLCSAFITVGENSYLVSTWHNAKSPKSMGWLDADVIFYEHKHLHHWERELITKPNKSSKTFTLQYKYHVQTGSFQGWGGYAADKGYPISECGTNIVRLNGGTYKKRGIKVYSDIEDIL